MPLEKDKFYLVADVHASANGFFGDLQIVRCDGAACIVGNEPTVAEDLETDLVDVDMDGVFDFAGFTFTPTVALTAITGRIPGSPSQAVALSMPLGDGNTWTSNVTIAANSTSVAALPVILGGGTKTLTATPAGTIFGVQTLAVNPATTPTPTITLPYAAVTLTVKATIAGTATAGAVVTLTPAGGTTPQTTAVPAGGGDPVAIFRDIPPGPYSMTATVTATGATGTLPTAALDVGAQARSVVMAVP